MSGTCQSLSVIIPCFNEEEYIGRTIDSVKAQRYHGEYEIIVVDNDSTDDTVRIIMDKGISLVRAKRRGPAPVKNEGIKKAKGDIIVFIDGDCIAAKDWLSKMVSGFEDPGIGCVAGEIMSDEKKALSPLEEFLILKGHLYQKQHLEHHFLPYAAAANAAYRRELIDKIGFFDERLFSGEDADFSWRMQLFTEYKIAYVPQAIVFHPYESSLKNLFKQKRRHAFGSVMTYKKYKKYRQNEVKNLKQIYWEYHSIIRRWHKVLLYKLKRRKQDLPEVDDYQLVLETAWKVGLIQGSIRHRTWYV